MDRHSGLVYRVCQTVLGEKNDADDAFQATFLVLVRHARKLEAYASIAGWLYKVALRTAVAARTKRGRKEQAIMTEPIEDSGAFSAIEQQELAFSLHEELAKLPEQYRTPLILCYLNGKSRVEVAQQLDVTTQTIKARLARGRAKLRSNLTRREWHFPCRSRRAQVCFYTARNVRLSYWSRRRSFVTHNHSPERRQVPLKLSLTSPMKEFEA